jgi:hypothetical protein
MANEWITAATALRYLSNQTYTYNEQRTICERAHSGLIAARAETLIWGDETRASCKLPKEFWWAEGAEALEQNWATGDFSTWIDDKIEVKAFGVSFDFLAITELAPAEKRAEGIRRISVAAHPAWLHARDLSHTIYAQTSSMQAGAEILEACKLGQITARAARASGFADASRSGKSSEWAAIEWDVPLWFWREFTESHESTLDWRLGTARGKAFRNGARQTIELQGLHFHRSGMAFLGLTDSEQETEAKAQSNRGRRPKYDWPTACVSIYGKLARGELMAKVQADVEQALIAHLTVGDDGPNESTVRPYAKLLWEDHLKP